MRHLQADSALPQESHRGPSREEEEEEEEAEAASRSWKPRPRGVLVDCSPPELSCQKVYQVSIFSPPAGCSHLPEQRAPGRQPVKRSCPEPQRVVEDEWDAKRGCWGEAGDEAIEDGLLVDALALGGAAQHFSHSGLRVVEHRQDGHADGHRWHADCGPGTAPATRQHTLCDVLHTKDYASDGPQTSEASGRPEEEEVGLPQDEEDGVGTSRHPVQLDPELHNLAHPPSPGKPLPPGAAGLAEPGTPEGGPNGLGSAEKTPCSSPRLPTDSPGPCRAKRKLLPSVAGVTDPGSADESRPPARKKRALLHPAAPPTCRSTDAKGAPFWNHLLPAAKDSAKSSSSSSSRLRGQLQTGLRALKPRPFRRSLVDGRPPSSPWVSSTSTSRALLGNFEESMLKGCFPPSGQIEGFTAEIGASGSYCPQHATLPVEVTYFDIAEHGAPSPFLGVIDLETLGKKGYSIPKSGTLQVTLFNPNKTVVKMFLVTYDFRDMPANHITFLRHRIFLVPVGEGEPEVLGQPPRRVLCYLMHLRFHSSKSGKIYLHDNIRLLFSRKSIEVDSGIPYELKSFTELPRNPCYSPRA